MTMKDMCKLLSEADIDEIEDALKELEIKTRTHNYEWRNFDDVLDDIRLKLQSSIYDLSVEFDYNDLLKMNGQTVLVEDETFDYPIQKCTVSAKEKYDMELNEHVMCVELENDDYCFDYDSDGECVGGDFRVYQFKMKDEA